MFNQERYDQGLAFCIGLDGRDLYGAIHEHRLNLYHGADSFDEGFAEGLRQRKRKDT